MPSTPPLSSLVGLIKLDNTFGAIFIGMVLTAILFGVSCLQVYMYYHEFSEDVMVYRTSVAFLLVLDAVLLAVSMHSIYYYLITNFGNYLALAEIVWSFKLLVLMNVVIVHFVLSLYAIRLWKLDYGKLIWPRITPLIIPISFACGLLLSVKVYQLNSFSEMRSLGWVIDLSLGTLAAADFIIAGTMCFFLYRSKSDFHSTNSIISLLLVWTLGTGLTTSVCSFAVMILFATMPRNLVFVGLEMLLGKLYFNSFLAMLNARKSMRKPRTEKGSEEGFSSFNFVHSRSDTANNSRIVLPKFAGSDKRASIPLTVITDSDSGDKMQGSLASPQALLRSNADNPTNIVITTTSYSKFDNF